MIEIVRKPIDLFKVYESIVDPTAGGIDIFVGTTRNNAEGKKVLSLEYEAYEPMALREMESIAANARRIWEVIRISIVHRIGAVDVGEASIAIAVSAAHRREAFEACRYIIDTVKTTVPIWKKERFTDSESWVGKSTTV
ncbi:MAG TPA: molybdenum cofactor biosynthesis protein MoaE [Bacteroidota bacterium]|nr:molybdenum cofactor biosynthesis protein MoaE [Bacteroidota bacterium]